MPDYESSYDTLVIWSFLKQYFEMTCKFCTTETQHSEGHIRGERSCSWLRRKLEPVNTNNAITSVKLCTTHSGQDQGMSLVRPSKGISRPGCTVALPVGSLDCKQQKERQWSSALGNTVWKGTVDSRALFLKKIDLLLRKNLFLQWFQSSEMRQEEPCPVLASFWFVVYPARKHFDVSLMKSDCPSAKLLPVGILLLAWWKSINLR